MSVDEDLLYAECFLLIGNSILDLFLIKDSQVGIVAFLQVSSFFDHEPVCNSTCHLADGIWQRVSEACDSILQEFRETVVNGRVLDAEVLHPGIGHVENVVLVFEVADNLGSGLGPHVGTACEVTLLAEHQVCVEVGKAFFLCNLMHGLAFILLQSGSHIGDKYVVEGESEQDA